MIRTDAVVVGAGVLGCFAARSLVKLNIEVTVIEQREDVCTGISRANTGIIYTGCDNRPGSLKAKMCVRANEGFDSLCRELGVRFSRCGSLMAAFGPRGEAVLEKKIRFGMESGVKGLRILDREEILSMEPGLSPAVTAALYAPGTGTIDPWELGIATYENARANGARFHFGTRLLHMERTSGGFRLETDQDTIEAKAVINCAGLAADAVREMFAIPAVRIFPTAADYIVLDDALNGTVRHVIFHEPEEKKKGLTLVPTVDGSILVGPTEREHGSAPDGATKPDGLNELRELCESVFPGLPVTEQIRSFSAIRPNPYEVEQTDGIWVPRDRSINDFMIMEDEGLISMIGVKTPGLTCAAELGEHCSRLVAAYLKEPGPNPDFDPVRKTPVRVHELNETERAALVAADPEYGEVLCQCGDISRGEIRDAILRGAVTLDGVKRRAGTGMGRCQGARCMMEILKMLSKAGGLRPEDITKDGAGSAVLFRKTNGNGTL